MSAEPTRTTAVRQGELAADVLRLRATVSGMEQRAAQVRDAYAAMHARGVRVGPIRPVQSDSAALRLNALRQALEFGAELLATRELVTSLETRLAAANASMEALRGELAAERERCSDFVTKLTAASVCDADAESQSTASPPGDTDPEACECS
jgi:hypothetical protein